MFGDIRTGILLFVTHILACITVGIIFRFWKHSKNDTISASRVFSSRENNVNIANLGEIISSSIMNSIHNVLLIGGFIVLFSVIISILNQSHVVLITSKFLNPFLNFLKIDTKFSSGLINGLIEITNGLNSVSSVHIKAISQNIIIASFLLGFGGLCVMLQVFSTISKSHISIKPYIIGKVLQSLIAALYTYIFLNINFFNLDIV